MHIKIESKMILAMQFLEEDKLVSIFCTERSSAESVRPITIGISEQLILLATPDYIIRV